VVVAEQIREPVRRIGLPPDDGGRGRTQEPQVIPEVLLALAPLVQVVVVWSAARARERRPPAAVAALQTGLDDPPTLGPDRPFVHAGANGAQFVRLRFTRGT